MLLLFGYPPQCRASLEVASFGDGVRPRMLPRRKGMHSLASFERVSLGDECGRDCSRRERKSIYAEAGFVKMRPCHPNSSAPGRWGRQRNCWRSRRQFRSAANVGGRIIFLRRVLKASDGQDIPRAARGRSWCQQGPPGLNSFWTEAFLQTRADKEGRRCYAGASTNPYCSFSVVLFKTLVYK